MKHKYLFYKENNEDCICDVNGFRVFDTIKEANEHLLDKVNSHIKANKSDFNDPDDFADFEEELLATYDPKAENVLYDPYYEVTFVTKKIPYQEKK